MRKTALFFCCSFFLQFIVLSTSAQSYNYAFEHYTTDNGLSHDQVYCVLKDRRGFMWFGTRNGLNRFDGYSFKIFTRSAAEKNSLFCNTVTALAQDPYGLIWVSTSEGICFLDPSTEKFSTLNLPQQSGDESSYREASNLAVDQQRWGWFERGKYLYRVDLKTHSWKRFLLPTTNRNSNTIYVDHNNNIWLILQGALYRFDRQTQTAKYYIGKDELHAPNKTIIMSIRNLSDGLLWMESWGQGLLYYDENKDCVMDYPDANVVANTFSEDWDVNHQSFLWVGGEPNGLAQFNFKEGQYQLFKRDIREPYSHNGSRTNAIYSDTSDQIVWIATDDGIEKYDHKSIRFKRLLLPENSELDDEAVSCVLNDKTDPSGKSYWLGIWPDGMKQWNSKTNEFKAWKIKEGLKSLEVFDMVQDRFGAIWIGETGGVQVFDPKTEKFTAFYHDFLTTPFLNHKILRLYEDDQSNIWICANYEGLFEWQRRSGKIVRWDLPGSPSPGKRATATSVQEDSDHNIWVSGWAGLYKINPSTKDVRFISNSGRKGLKLPREDLSTVWVDRNNRPWVGGVGFLAQLDQAGEITQLYNETNGLHATSIFKIVQDRKGYIWAASDNYLHRVDPEKHFVNYFGKEDGLISNEQTDGFDLLPDGTLVIGFQSSFCMIDAANVPLNYKKPEVHLSEVIAGSEQVFPDHSGKVAIGPDETSLLMEFTLLNYTQSQKNSFAYRLDDETKWLYTSSRQFALSNLAGGNHVLHVKAKNNDGVWSEETPFQIRVVPPFRDSNWFKVIIIAVIGTGVGIVYWYRRQARRKVESIRNRIATDLHDDMGSTLSSIRILSDVAKKDVASQNPRAATMLDKIESDAALLSENMQDIVWTIKTHHNSIGDVVTRMKEYALKIVEAKDINFQTHIAENFKASKLDIAQRRNIYLIFKETINNAVKYSGCSQIQLFITQQNRHLKMVVEDNGCGFDIHTIKKGNGLDNLQKRAEEIKGKLCISSEKGKGTRIDLVVKL